MRKFAAGFDIGGTKCAVVLAEMPETDGALPRLIGKIRFATAEFPRPEECLAQLCLGLRTLSEEHRIPLPEIGGIGISCGGPLDPEKGVIQSPPNLPG